jgi:hypothetical protein
MLAPDPGLLAFARPGKCRCQLFANATSRPRATLAPWRRVDGRAGEVAVAIGERRGAVAVADRGAVEAAVAIGEAGRVADRCRATGGCTPHANGSCKMTRN